MYEDIFCNENDAVYYSIAVDSKLPFSDFSLQFQCWNKLLLHLWKIVSESIFLEQRD